MKAAAAEVQRAFAHLDWIAPTPPYFLHVTLHEPLPARPFTVEYSSVNCFHEAVVVEVESPALAGFLPHLTIGYVREPGSAAELRAALEPLRDVRLGRQHVDEPALCRVPASRGTVLEPWTVVRRLQLER